MKALIIGTGGIGKRHIRGFLKTERVELSIVEPDEERRAEVLADYEIVAGFQDVGDVDLAIFDVVVICVPAHVHVKLGQACADAGISFLMEKPLSVSMEGVDRMIDTVNSKGLIARVAYVRRAAMEVQDMRQQILDGRIGEPRLCYMNTSQEFPKYRPDFQTTYYAKKSMGGGAVLDCASHLIDLLLWVFGEPSEVMGMYDRLQLEGVECEDTCLISIRFKNDCMAQININQFQKPDTCTFEMIGTKGSLMLDMATLKFAGDDSGTWTEHNYMEGMNPMEAHEARFALQSGMILDAIEGKPCNLTTLEEARNNLRVALAAKQSYDTKKIIQLK